MKQFVVTACLLTGILFANGCATKKYVRNTVAPVQAKVEQVGEQTTQNTQVIEKTRGDLNQVDERAQAGISAAQERAATADQHAMTADQHAGSAMTRANDAKEMADRVNGELRDVVANIDDYKLQSTVSVPFKFNRATLTPEAKRHLDEVVAQSTSDKRFLITIEGFTDNVGSTQYNLALSRRRADAVVAYLVSRHNIPIYRIHVVGLGKDNPVTQVRTAAARAQNRRAEVRLFTADGVEAALKGPSETSASRSIPAPPNE